MRDDTTTACCAATFGLALLLLSDDASDAFVQLYIRPGERWLAYSLFLDDGGDLQCVEEGVFGYGAALSPNIFQRLALALGSVAVDYFEGGEAALLALNAERGELSARIVAYVAARTALSAETGQIELRFCTFTPHTDDFWFATFGVDRMPRLVSC